MGGFIVTEAQGQEANIQPPRRGQCITLTVDSTTRNYDLRVLAINGQNYQQNAAEAVYLTLHNDSAATSIYFYFSPDGSSTAMNPASSIAAGGALAFSNAYCDFIPAGQAADVRIRRDIDQFLTVATASGTATLRFSASSDSTQQAQ